MKLNEDEYLVLDNFVSSQAYVVLKKVMDQDIAVVHDALEGEKDPLAIYRFQGRLAGLKVLQSLPPFLKNRGKKDEEEKKREADQEIRFQAFRHSN